MATRRPKRYLSSREVGERLGLSARAVTQRAARNAGTIPAADVVISHERGEVYGWNPARKDLAARNPGDHPDDPALLGADPAQLPDEFVIGMRMWAALDGVTVEHVRNLRSAASRNRALGRSKQRDMPPEDFTEGNSPRWHMSTRRAWEKARG